MRVQGEEGDSHHVSLTVLDGVTVVVPRLQVHSERRSLDLGVIDRKRAHSSDEEVADLREESVQTICVE